MPRRRNCASSMFEIWGANSSLSGMCDRHCMFFPGTCVQDLFDLREREVALFLSIVKMRRNAYAGLGPVVDEDLSRKEFAAHFERMGALDGNSPSTLRGIFRSVDSPAPRLRAFDQSRRHSNRFFTDRGNSNFIENIQSRPAGVECWDMRRAVQIAKGILARVNRAGLESKRPPMGNPSGQRGAQFGAQVLTYIEISNAGPATEPLQNSANREIRTQASNVQRDSPRRLKRIEDDV